MIASNKHGWRKGIVVVDQPSYLSPAETQALENKALRQQAKAIDSYVEFAGIVGMQDVYIEQGIEHIRGLDKDSARNLRKQIGQTATLLNGVLRQPSGSTALAPEITRSEVVPVNPDKDVAIISKVATERPETERQKPPRQPLIESALELIKDVTHKDYTDLTTDDAEFLADTLLEFGNVYARSRALPYDMREALIARFENLGLSKSAERAGRVSPSAINQMYRKVRSLINEHYTPEDASKLFEQRLAEYRGQAPMTEPVQLEQQQAIEPVEPTQAPAKPQKPDQAIINRAEVLITQRREALTQTKTETTTKPESAEKVGELITATALGIVGSITGKNYHGQLTVKDADWLAETLISMRRPPRINRKGAAYDPQEVLRLRFTNMSGPLIARKLYVSEGTVGNCITTQRLLVRERYTQDEAREVFEQRLAEYRGETSSVEPQQLIEGVPVTLGPDIEEQPIHSPRLPSPAIMPKQQALRQPDVTDTAEQLSLKSPLELAEVWAEQLSLTTYEQKALGQMLDPDATLFGISPTHKKVVYRLREHLKQSVPSLDHASLDLDSLQKNAMHKVFGWYQPSAGHIKKTPQAASKIAKINGYTIPVRKNAVLTALNKLSELEPVTANPAPTPKGPAAIEQSVETAQLQTGLEVLAKEGFTQQDIAELTRCVTYDTEGAHRTRTPETKQALVKLQNLYIRRQKQVEEVTAKSGILMLTNVAVGSKTIEDIYYKLHQKDQAISPAQVEELLREGMKQLVDKAS